MLAPAIQAADITTPDDTIVRFFKALDSGAFEEGYKLLFEGSGLEKEKPQSVQAAIAQTSAAFSLYGKILAWEKVDEQAFGTSLRKIRYLMITKVPVAWVFYFWKPKDQWVLAHVRFNDQVHTVLN